VASHPGTGPTSWCEKQRLCQSYASRSLAHCRSLTIISNFLSHNQKQATARYTHRGQDSVQNAAARFSGSIGGSLTLHDPPVRASSWQRPRDRSGM